MKTFLAIVLCFCAGCGVSEQERLAKRINDKMDIEESREKRLKPFIEDRDRLELTAENKIRKIELQLEYGKFTPDEKIQLLRDKLQIEVVLHASINKLLGI